jgi:hypothetical protein
MRKRTKRKIMKIAWIIVSVLVIISMVGLTLFTALF